MYPSERELEIAILVSIIELGGESRTKDIYPLVTDKFPNLTKDELDATVLSRGQNKWINKIQWARASLKIKKELYSVSFGVWGITQKGRDRVKKG